MMRKTLFCVSLLLLLTFTACQQDETTGNGEAPTILSMTPNQAVAGQANVNGTIRGTNYKGIVAVDLGGDIQIHSTNIVNPTELSVVFSVNSNATPGPKTVRVTTLKGTASLEGGLSVSDNKTPVASFTASPSNTGKGVPIHFDASASSDPDGSISKYEWNFGDGASASGVQTDHSYASKGNFTATLTVTDNKGGKGSAIHNLVVEDTRPPHAHFSMSPQNGDTSTVFRFDASNSADDGRIVKYSWAFGDEKHDEGKVVHHKYSKSGEFPVTLTVTDNHDLSGENVRHISVRGKQPIADFHATPSSAAPGKVISFDGSDSRDEDGHIVTFNWDMGDATKLNGKLVTHKYAKNGSFPVKLTVTDDSGLSDSASQLMSISTSSPPPSSPPPSGGTLCTKPAKNNGFIYGNVVGVTGNWAIVQLPAGSTCANSFYYCGDMRLAGATGLKEFFGIIKSMKDLGNGKFMIFNDCPANWPPAIGDKVFLYYKTCAVNHCPG
jgi:PKD repeat protein